MILFASNRPLGRCENITAIWNAYRGAKEFTDLGVWRTSEQIRNGGYDILVTDEFPSQSKAPVIMVYHGLAAGKTYGLDQPHKYHTRRAAELLTWVITSSRDAIPIAAKQCGVPKERVKALGMPRTDAYIGKHKGDGKSGLPMDKRIYLYAPTFRNEHEPEAPEIDYEMIDRLLKDNELLVLKHHMVTGTQDIGQYKHIIQAPPSAPTTPYLIDCDVLITDYSSIMSDAHLLGKPVVLFEKDAEEYMKARGMYRAYPQGYAARHVTDEKDLVRVMRVAKKQMQADIQCKWETAGACDGHSTERVIKLIGEMLSGY